MYLRRDREVTKKTSFLRCIWDVLKTSQKRRLFWDVSERSLRCLSQWRSVWDISKNSHVGWDTWIDKSLSLGGKSLLVVALNYRSFAPTLRYQAPARNSCRSYCLDVTWTSKDRSTRSPTYWQYGGGVPHAWSFEIVENLERFTNLRVILGQEPC